jgi:hypothetical protein
MPNTDNWRIEASKLALATIGYENSKPEFQVRKQREAESVHASEQLKVDA